MNDLKDKTIKGVAWSGISQFGKQLCQVLITAVMARMLTPTDFGLIGMATVFTGFITIFNTLGVSSALIQKQDTTTQHLSSAFWLNVFFGLFLTVFFICVSPWIARFYHQPGLNLILIVLSLNFFISSFSTVQRSVLIKEMEFKILTKRDITAIILSGIIGIIMAFYGFGVWSLVGQSLALTFFNAYLLWTLSPWKPQWYFSLKEIKDIFLFSSNVTGFNIVNYFARNVDYLLIGKFLGGESLGFYTLAYKMMLVPIANISWVLCRVMFPAFSKIQHDIARVRRNYLKIIQVVSLVTFPLLLGLFAIAPELVEIFLGSHWKPSVPIIQILCFCGMVQSVTSVGGVIYLSLGRPGLQLSIGIINTILASLSILYGLQYGVTGVALSYTIFYILWGQVSLFIVCHLTHLKPRELYAQLGSSLLISIAMMVAVLLIRQYIKLTSIWILCLSILFGFLFYFGLLFLTKRNFLNALRLEFTKIKII
jgi:O-antigen/teichoic acid export membrane protein